MQRAGLLAFKSHRSVPSNLNKGLQERHWEVPALHRDGPEASVADRPRNKRMVLAAPGIGPPVRRSATDCDVTLHLNEPAIPEARGYSALHVERMASDESIDGEAPADALASRVAHLTSIFDLHMHIDGVFEAAVLEKRSLLSTFGRLMRVLAQDIGGVTSVFVRALDDDLVLSDFVYEAVENPDLPVPHDIICDACDAGQRYETVRSNWSVLASKIHPAGLENEPGTVACFFDVALTKEESAHAKVLIAEWCGEVAKHMRLVISARRRLLTQHEITLACATGTFAQGVERALAVLCKQVVVSRFLILLFMPTQHGFVPLFLVVANNRIVLDHLSTFHADASKAEMVEATVSFGIDWHADLGRPPLALAPVRDVGANVTEANLRSRSFSNATQSEKRRPVPRVSSMQSVFAKPAPDAAAAAADMTSSLSVVTDESVDMELRDSLPQFLLHSVDELMRSDDTRELMHAMDVDEDEDSVLDLVVRDCHGRPSARAIASVDGCTDLTEHLMETIFTTAMAFQAEWRRFGHHMNAQHVQRLLSAEAYAERILRPVVRPCAVLYSDVSSFSSLSDTVLVDPGTICDFIEVWADAVVSIIKANNGVFDKLVGDCVIAYFGPPFFEESATVSCANALRCARQIRDYTRSRLADEPKLASVLASSKDRLGVATGLNFCPMSIGFAGNNAGFTAFSSGMNETARLQSLASTHEILAMDSFAAHLADRDDVRFSAVRHATVKNIASPIVYRQDLVL